MSTKKRNKLIPDKLFNKMWNAANTATSKKEYMNDYLLSSSEKYINFKKKYELEYEQAANMLSEVYDKAKMSFPDVLQLCKARNRDIVDIFCIPVRTVEDWKTEKNMCPSYIKLMILRFYHKIDLGKYVYLESEKFFKDSIPSAYNTYLPRKKQAESVCVHKKSDKLEEILNMYETQKKSSYDEYNVKNILTRTDYLKEIMHKH